MSEKGNKILCAVLSFLLAIVFWLYVDDNSMKQDFTNIPIDFLGELDTLPSRGLMLAEGGDTTLDVTISGPRTVIAGLRPGDIRAQVNLTSISAVGPYSLGFDLVYPDGINSSDITIESQSRSAVSVQVTSLYSKEVPININVVGEVSEPYMYTAVGAVAEPSVLTISGLRDNVDMVASARVVVDITGATSTIQREFDYELLDSEGNVVENPDIRTSETRASVTVPIHMTKVVPLTMKVKDAAGSREADVEWKLEPDAITVAGDPLSLETLDEIVLGELDLSAYQMDVEDVPQEIKIPAGCENISGYSSTNLSIKYKGLSTRSFTVTDIRRIGLSESQRFDPITRSLDVLLRGPEEDLELVTEEDIRIVVDLTEIASDGTVTVPATVLVDGYSEVGAAGTYSVTGKIISR